MKYMLIIDPDTWQQFKIACTRDRISMAKKIKELIQDYLKKGERGKK